MTRFSKIYNSNNIRVFFLIVFVFIGFSSFAQTTSIDDAHLNVSNEVFNVVADELVATSARLNSNEKFILWFMGTKANPNDKLSNEGGYTKKQIISSGTVPNHLLMKTLLKKTINSKFC
jgi:hypothetical protein